MSRWLWILVPTVLGCGSIVGASGPKFRDLPAAHKGPYDGVLLPFPAERTDLPDRDSEFGWGNDERFLWGYISDSGRVVVRPDLFSLLDPIVGDQVGVGRVTWREERANGYQMFSQQQLLGERGTKPVGERRAWIAPDVGDVFRARDDHSSMGVTKGYLLDRSGAVVANVHTWSHAMADVGPFVDGLAVASRIFTVGELRSVLPDETMRSLAERGWSEDEQEINHSPMAWGLLDARGAWVIDPTWKMLGAYRDGLMPASGKDSPLVGFIDRTGAWKIPPGFSSATSFAHGVAVVWGAEGCQFIQSDGQPLFDAWDTRCEVLGPRYLRVVRDGDLQILDREGKPSKHLASFDKPPKRIGLASGDWLAVNAGAQFETAWWLVNASGERLTPEPLVNASSPCFIGGMMLAILPGDPDSGQIRTRAGLVRGGYLRSDGTWAYGPTLGPWDELTERWTARCEGGA